MKTYLLRPRLACFSLALGALLAALPPLHAQGIVIDPDPPVVREHRPGFFERLFGPKKPRHHVRVNPDETVVERTTTVVYPDGRVEGTVVSVDGQTPVPTSPVVRSDVIRPGAPQVNPEPRRTEHLEIPVSPNSRRTVRPAVPNRPAPQDLDPPDAVSGPDDRIVKRDDPATPSAVTEQHSPEPAAAPDSTAPKSAPLKKRTVAPAPDSQIADGTPPPSTEPKTRSSDVPAPKTSTPEPTSKAPDPKGAASPPKNNALVDMPPAEKKDIKPESKQAGKEYPVGSRSNKPGFVKSPYEPFNELDATGMITGSLARDPTTGKIFRMP